MATLAKRQSRIDERNQRYEDYVKTVDGRPKPRQHFDIEMDRADLDAKKVKRASQRLLVDEETHNNYMANGGDVNVTFEQWERLPPLGRVRLQRNADEKKSIESGGTSFPSMLLPGGMQHWKDASRVNNIVPPVTEAFMENPDNMGLNMATTLPFMENPDNMGVPPVITDNGAAKVAQVPAILENNRGFTPDKTAVKPIEAVYAEDLVSPQKAPFSEDPNDMGVVPKTKDMIEKDDPKATGSSDYSEYSPDGSLKNGEGEDVIQTEEEKERNRGIFDKASNLFGDIFSAPDLKRMTLYTIGGLLTGGSLEGSFKWAGLKVMDEQQKTKANNAAIEAENVRFEREMYKLDKQYAQDDKKQSTLFGYSKETASILSAGRKEAAKIIADASLLDSNARARAQVLANSVMAKATLAAQTLKANALLGAATTKFNRDQNKSNGKATGTTKDWAIEGFPGLTEATSIQYDLGTLGKKSIVTYKDPNTGEQKQQYLTDFKAMIRKMGGGKISENQESVNNRAAQSKIIGDWSKSLRTPVENLFNRESDIAGLNTPLNPEYAIVSAANYWDTRGYDLASYGQRNIAKQATLLAAGDAAKYAASTGEEIFTIDPFIDKQVFSVEALGGDSGVWQIGDGKGPGVSPAKVIQFRDKIRRMSMFDSDKDGLKSDANLKRAKNQFQRLWSSFKNLDSSVKENLDPGDDENKFLVYANGILDTKV